jgi:uncharacterized oligopeptide transporter (OPT) family protein
MLATTPNLGRRAADRTRNPEGAKQLGVLLASGLIVAEGIIARKLAKGFSG